MVGRSKCAVCAEKEQKKKRELYDADPERYRNRDKAYYARRKENRLCVKCGKPLEPGNGRVRCLACTRKLAAHDRARTVRQRPPEKNWPRGDNGICYICNRNPKQEGRNSCAECYGLLRENMLRAKAAQDLSAHPWNHGRAQA